MSFGGPRLGLPLRVWRRATHRALRTILACRTDERVIALTFDDGPTADGTPDILERLSRYRAKATFFMIGRRALAHPAIVRAVVTEGHAVGNHSFTHPLFPRLSPAGVARELLSCRRVVQEVAGVRTSLMRPPHGALTSGGHVASLLTGHTVVHWSASGEDWSGAPASRVAEQVLETVRAGSIVLLHDGWEPETVPGSTPAGWRAPDRRSTVEALGIVLEELDGRGYRFVTLPDLLRLGRPTRAAWLW